MKELKELLLSGDNLVLAAQMSRVIETAQAACLARFYGKVEDALREGIRDLPPIDPEWAHLVDESGIKRQSEGVVDWLRAASTRLGRVRGWR